MEGASRRAKHVTCKPAPAPALAPAPAPAPAPGLGLGTGLGRECRALLVGLGPPPAAAAPRGLPTGVPWVPFRGLPTGVPAGVPLLLPLDRSGDEAGDRWAASLGGGVYSYGEYRYRENTVMVDRAR